MNEYYDAIIVGTGAAGLYCALNLPSRMKILMITKQQADQSDSFLAQGGICIASAVRGIIRTTSRIPCVQVTTKTMKKLWNS